MNFKLAQWTILIASFLLVGSTAWAHHGNSAYDEEHSITITGTVTEFVWSNPHCQFFLNVKDDKGHLVLWAIESQSPGIMRRNNWTRTSLKPGDQITVTFNAAKNGNPVGFSGNESGKVVFSDGRVLKMDVR